jgi:oligoribonuclease NrnB/cAMP/cGMP phosphodiesterase (DHH superfamily)
MKYVFYHGDCLDGFTAAWVMFCHFKKEAEYFPIQPGEEVPKNLLTKDNDFFFVDYCPQREELLEIERKARSVLVFDHHKSSFEKCGDLPFCKFDMNKCGAGVALEFVESQPFANQKEGTLDYWRNRTGFFGAARRLVGFVEDQDLWKFEMEETKVVNAFLRNQEKTFKNWESACVQLWNDSAKPQLIKIGVELLKQERQIVDHHKSKASNVNIFGYQDVPIVNISYGNRSLILNELCREDYFAVGWSYFEGSVKYSLRSKGTFDVEVLARKFGQELGIGGGHKDAASFTSKHFPDYFISQDVKDRTFYGY